MSACDACLRRSHLIALLAPRIAGLLREPLHRRPVGLLALPEADLLAAVGGRGAHRAARMAAELDPEGSRQEIGSLGMHAACRHDRTYPPRLLELGDPPAVLYTAGALPAAVDGRPAVTIVGSRQASRYGLECARSLAREVAGAGAVVVSGLALGIDAAAHRGALEADGQSIAVLAGGPDHAYPRSNRTLYEQLLQDGLVASEMPPRARPERWGFAARNRIMAGLAHVTVVVEAGQPSGSLITARFAGELGRTVGAVPGRVTARMAAGSNALLRDGARVVLDGQDVLDELFGAGERTVAPAVAAGPLSRVERAALDAIEGGAGPEEIAGCVRVSPGEARACLARLESLGLIARHGLGGYERTEMAVRGQE